MPLVCFGCGCHASCRAVRGCCAIAQRYLTALANQMAIKCCLFTIAACVAGSAAAAAVCWHCPGSVVQSMHRQRQGFMQMQAQPVNQNRQFNLAMPNTTAQSCDVRQTTACSSRGRGLTRSIPTSAMRNRSTPQKPRKQSAARNVCLLLALRSHMCSGILCRILHCTLPVMRICLCGSPRCQNLQCSYLFGSSSNLRGARPWVRRSSSSSISAW